MRRVFFLVNIAILACRLALTDLVHQRHPELFEFLDKDAGSVSGMSSSSSTKSSYLLMQSPCLPDSNGYFGGTSGMPLVMEYGYEMEFAPRTDTSSALQIIRQYILDQVLSTSFPEVCSITTNRKLSQGDVQVQGKMTGFQFLKEFVDPDRK